MEQQGEVYGGTRYCRAQLIHALAKHVKSHIQMGRSTRITYTAILQALPDGVHLAAVCTSKAVSSCKTVQGITAAGGVVSGCGKHAKHMRSSWPRDCVGLPATVITVTKLPESWVDQAITDNPRQKQLLKRNLDLNITFEDLAYFAKSTLVEHDEYHLLGCQKCERDHLPSVGGTNGLGDLVCCSGCPASYHGECLKCCNMDHPTDYREKVPEAGCGDLWLCPLCVKKLRPGAGGSPSVGHGVLPRPQLTKALMAESAADGEFTPIGEWRNTRMVLNTADNKIDIPGRPHEGYLPCDKKKYPECIAKERAYILKLQSWGLELPGWLEIPDTPETSAASGATAAAPPANHTQVPAVAVPPLAPPLRTTEQTSARRRRAAQLVDVDNRASKRQTLDLPQLLAALVNTYKYLMKWRPEATAASSSSSSSNSRQTRYDSAVAAIMFEVWLDKKRQLSNPATAEAAAAVRDPVSGICNRLKAAAYDFRRVPAACTGIDQIMDLFSNHMARGRAEQQGGSADPWSVLLSYINIQPQLDAAAKDSEKLQQTLQNIEKEVAIALAAMLSSVNAA